MTGAGAGPVTSVGAPLVMGVLFALVLVGCGNGGGPPGPSPPEREDVTRRLDVGERQRSYRLLVPASASGEAPVLVVLHDAGGSPDSIVEVTQFDRAAVEGGFAVAYPAAVAEGGTWNAGFCCGPAPDQGVDDLAFLDRVVGDLADHPRIDPDRVHLAGVSNGAILAYRYACEHAGRIAGLASVAGAMVLDGCRPSAPVSVLEIHGTADQIVPFQGGRMPEFVMARQPVPAVHDLMRHWARVNDCSPPTERTDAPVTTTTWGDCRGGTMVRLIAVEGGGHTWYAPAFGPVDGAVDATAAITDFLGLADS